MQNLYLTNLQPYFFLVAGIAAILYAVFKKTPTDSLLAKGEKVEGIVFELGSKSSSDYSSPDINDKVTVRFVTNKLEWITAELKTDFGIYYTGQYKEGDKVEVVYNPDHPNEFILSTKQSESTARLLVVLAGFILMGIGVYQLLKD